MDIFATLLVAPILDYISETVQVLGLQILKGEALVVILSYFNSVKTHQDYMNKTINIYTREYVF